MSAALERRYSRLLRLYPAAYREARGSEVLDTLLAAAEDGRIRPAWRESGALALGALRAHAGRRHGAGASLLTACRVAALMLLVSAVASTASQVGTDLTYFGPLPWRVTEPEALNAASLLLAVIALVAALRRWHLAGALAAATAFGLATAVSWPMRGMAFPGFWHLPLATVLLLVLVRRDPRPGAGVVRHLPLLPVLLVLAEPAVMWAFPVHYGFAERALLVAVGVGALLWLAVDERVAMALGLYWSTAPLVQVIFAAQTAFADPVVVLLGFALVSAGPAVLLAASSVVARRQAEI